MSTQQSPLFTPLQMGNLVLANRLVLAPLTRNRAGDENVPTDLNTLYYTQRSSAGLLITEGSQISSNALGYPGTPGIHSKKQIAGWKKITDAVHKEGSLIFIQLWHTGRISHSSILPDNALPVAPSAIRPMGEAITYTGMQDFETPRALEIDDISDVINDYVDAAKNAKSAGFDGVEIHSANGYLLDQFLNLCLCLVFVAQCCC
jgi:N-ethylmaleimide reductase